MKDNLDPKLLYDFVNSLSKEQLLKLIITFPTETLTVAMKGCPSPGCEMCRGVQAELDKRKSSMPRN